MHATTFAMRIMGELITKLYNMHYKLFNVGVAFNFNSKSFVLNIVSINYFEFERGLHSLSRTLIKRNFDSLN